uniref:Probable nicotinate-nucleotide adenylyltransferase n=1 Tax=Zeugodacus cucurbitae TaxID=28588 RepID=A0A0A1XF38_ZEUCU
MLPTTAFRRRNGYEDLDKCNQSLEEYLSSIQVCVATPTTTTTAPSLGQQKQQTNRIFSISDTALNLAPTDAHTNTLAAPLCCLSQQQSTSHASHNQSTLSLNNGISLGSIVLLPSQVPSPTRTTQSYANQQQRRYAPVCAAKMWELFYMRKANFRLLCFALFYCVYLAIGSVCFQIAETPVEESLRSAVRLLRTEFLLKYPQISGKFYLCKSICLLNISLPFWGRSTPKRRRTSVRECIFRW